MAGKIIIHCTLTVRTGLHIGTSDAFSAIGAVDSQVVRDPLSGLPVIPGSSLKGKIRTLLARSISKDIQNMPDFKNDAPEILRVFGSADPVKAARLQFADSFLSNAEEMRRVGFTEVKAENAINRDTSVANPRFIERVSAGSKFSVCLVYNIENESEVREDMELLAKGMKLLQMDYLGGHGSRGSGRVSLGDFRLEPFETDVDPKELQPLFDEVDSYELLPV